MKKKYLLFCSVALVITCFALFQKSYFFKEWELVFLAVIAAIAVFYPLAAIYEYVMSIHFRIWCNNWLVVFKIYRNEVRRNRMVSCREQLYERLSRCSISRNVKKALEENISIWDNRIQLYDRTLLHLDKKLSLLNRCQTEIYLLEYAIGNVYSESERKFLKRNLYSLILFTEGMFFNDTFHKHEGRGNGYITTLGYP